MVVAESKNKTDIDDSRLEWVRQAAIRYAAQPIRKIKYNSESLN